MRQQSRNGDGAYRTGGSTGHRGIAKRRAARHHEMLAAVDLRAGYGSKLSGNGAARQNGERGSYRRYETIQQTQIQCAADIRRAGHFELVVFRTWGRPCDGDI